MTTTEPTTQAANTESNGHRQPPADVVVRAVRLLIAPPDTAYTPNDVGNATRLVNTYAERVAWVPELRTWRVWDGDRWIDDTGRGRMRSVAHLVTHDMRKEGYDRLAKADKALPMAQGLARTQLAAEGFEDKNLDAEIKKHPLVKDVEAAKKAAEDLIKWALLSGDNKRLNPMIDQATGILGDDGKPVVEVGEEHWDTDPRLFNVANGTIELRPTGAVHRPHDMQDRITQICRVNYDALAKALRWCGFMEWALPDEELRTQVHIKLGQSLYGGNPQHQFILLKGTTRSGKTTLLETVAGVLGPDYASSYDPSLLRPKRESAGDPELLAVLDKRFIYTIEPSEGWAVNGERIKKLTGGDTLKARDNHARAKDFKARRPAFTPWLGANHMPQIQGADRALMDERLLPHPLSQYAEVRDLYLVDTLIREEAEGILTYLVEGYNPGCRHPELLTHKARLSVRLLKEVNEEISLYRRWIADCCDTCHDHRDGCCESPRMMLIGDDEGDPHRDKACQLHCKFDAGGNCTVHLFRSHYLWRSWFAWCKGHNHDPKNETAFGNALTDLGYPNRDPVTGRDYYTGVKHERGRARRGLRTIPSSLLFYH